MKLNRTVKTFFGIALVLVMNSFPVGAVADDAIKDMLEGLIGSALHKGLKPPKQISPSDFQQYTHYPRQLTLIWERSSNKRYDVEIDCHGCRNAGQWDSDGDSPLHRATDIAVAKLDYIFVGDNQGRWRVRVLKEDRQGKWSPWFHFKFNTSATSGSDTGVNYPDDPGYDPNYDPQGDDGQDGTPPPDYGNGSGQPGNYPPQNDPYENYSPAGPGQSAGSDGSGASPEYEQPYSGDGGDPGGQVDAGGQGDPNQDPNYDPNQDPGYDPNQDPGYDPNYDPNQSPGQDVGADSGADDQVPSDSGGPRFEVVRISPNLRLIAVKEDCVSFNPQSAKVVKRKGRWKIVDGRHWVFDFNKKKKEANRSLKIIKHYRINQSCYVGRLGPSFRYLLKSGKSPSGKMGKEDCTSFNRDNIKVAKRKGRWKIVDGSHWVFDFSNKEKEARKALAIIKRHKFSRSCFVGRPGPSLSYLRR